MLLSLVAIVLILWIFYRQWKSRKILKLSRMLKSKFPAFPLIGHAYYLSGSDEDRMNFVEAMGKEAFKNGGLASLWVGPNYYTIVTDPVVAEIVLRTCLDKPDIMVLLRHLFSNGSLFAPTNIWRPRRKLLAPIFSHKKLGLFVEIFAKHSNSLVVNLKPVTGTGAFTVSKYLISYVMATVCETALGVDMGKDENALLEAFEQYARLLIMRVCIPFFQIDALFNLVPSSTKYHKSIKFMRRYVDEIIALKRMETKNVPNNSTNIDENINPGHLKTFLELLMEVSDGNSGLSNEELREELLVVVLAGTLTSAIGASFVSCILSRHPDVQEKVYNELFEIYGESNDPVTFEDLPKFKYLEAVIRETLRLYPPIPFIARTLKKDVPLPSGITLVENTDVLFSIWSLHRNPLHWGPDAEEFNPDRFLNNTTRHPNAFMPFSSGPRNCLGYQHGIMSIKTMIATLLRHYKFLPIPTTSGDHLKKSFSLKFDILLRDRDGFKIQLEARRK